MSAGVLHVGGGGRRSCVCSTSRCGGHEEFRDDLRLLYFPSLAADTGALDALRMVPMQVRKMRLCHANTADSQWLRLVLERISRDFGTRVSRQPDGTLILPGPSQLPASRGGW